MTDKGHGGFQIVTSKMSHGGSSDQKWKIIRCGETEAESDKRRSLTQQTSEHDD
jgi:hypothetical protein